MSEGAIGGAWGCTGKIVGFLTNIDVVAVHAVIVYSLFTKRKVLLL